MSFLYFDLFTAFVIATGPVIDTGFDLLFFSVYLIDSTKSIKLLRNERFRFMSASDEILNSFPENFNVTLSSSNSFSEHRRTIPFSDYLNESLEQGETLPDQLSNETWYLFGETFSDEWKDFLSNYEIPNCIACDADLVALSFGIGNKGSGVQWHVHGPGFSEAIVGRKREYNFVFTADVAISFVLVLTCLHRLDIV